MEHNEAGTPLVREKLDRRVLKANLQRSIEAHKLRLEMARKGMKWNPKTQSAHLQESKDVDVTSTNRRFHNRVATPKAVMKNPKFAQHTQSSFAKLSEKAIEAEMLRSVACTPKAAYTGDVDPVPKSPLRSEKKLPMLKLPRRRIYSYIDANQQQHFLHYDSREFAEFCQAQAQARANSIAAANATVNLQRPCSNGVNMQGDPSARNAPMGYVDAAYLQAQHSARAVIANGLHGPCVNAGGQSARSVKMLQVSNNNGQPYLVNEGALLEKVTNIVNEALNEKLVNLENLVALASSCAASRAESKVGAGVGVADIPQVPPLDVSSRNLAGNPNDCAIKSCRYNCSARSDAGTQKMTTADALNGVGKQNGQGGGDDIRYKEVVDVFLDYTSTGRSQDAGKCNCCSGADKKHVHQFPMPPSFTVPVASNANEVKEEKPEYEEPGFLSKVFKWNGCIGDKGRRAATPTSTHASRQGSASVLASRYNASVGRVATAGVPKRTFTHKVFVSRRQTRNNAQATKIPKPRSVSTFIPYQHPLYRMQIPGICAMPAPILPHCYYGGVPQRVFTSAVPAACTGTPA